jgi:hypothetical protein
LTASRNLFITFPLISAPVSPPAAAPPVLADIYSWFTEAFDTADLIDAKAVLDELGA